MEEKKEEKKNRPPRPTRPRKPQQRPRRPGPRKTRPSTAKPKTSQKQTQAKAKIKPEALPAAVTEVAEPEPSSIKSVINKLFKAIRGKDSQTEAAPPNIPAEDVVDAISTEARLRSTKKTTRQSSRPAKGKNTTQNSNHSSKAKKGEKRPDPQKNESKEKAATKMRLLINNEEPEECRIALVEDGKVEAFHVETIFRTQTKGNIYKGRIVAVEPSLHAAFADIGLEKNAFLPFSEIHPEYFCEEIDDDTNLKDLNIAKILNKGQEVLVEVVKEAAGTKGANVTTYLSLPGRFLVLMPGSESHGISRKLDDKQRSTLRDMIQSFDLPEGIGYIVRTASKNVTKTALSKDVRYLLNLWRTIKNRGQKMSVPSLVYREQTIVARYLRDHFTTEIDKIIVDSQDGYDQVQSFLSLLPIRQQKVNVQIHRAPAPIFNHYNIENQIEQIYQPQVKLPSGGSIVINPTEALVAIDVNSGRTSKDKNFEESIFLANMEAAEELARQLRLRDLGGLIVVDFIDMRPPKHTREVEKKVKTCMKRDKAKFDITRISKFGLMQISRQRLRPPVHAESYKMCEHCHGSGVVQSVETQVLAYLRKIQLGVTRKKGKNVVCEFPLDIAQYFQNKKRSDLANLEEKFSVEIQIIGNPAMKPTEAKINFMS